MNSTIYKAIKDSIAELATKINPSYYLNNATDIYRHFLYEIKVAKLKESSAIAKAAADSCKPSVLYKPQLSYFGNSIPRKYCATYGECMGVGDTPAEAMENFDKYWIAG